MTCEHRAAGLLPFHLNGTLNPSERRRVERHLAVCPVCRADLALWREVSMALDATSPVPVPAESPRRTGLAGSRVSFVAALVAGQLRLIHAGSWWASALVMALGFVVAWAAGRTAVVSAVAPLVAVFGVSRLYGPQDDPAFELMQATPTSPRQILLARVVLVFGYDLILAVAASAALSLVLPGAVLGAAIGSWLAPMAFLSALALAGSVVVGSQAASALAFGSWILRAVVTAPLPEGAAWWGAAYEAWWNQPTWLFGLAGVLVVCGIWRAGDGERRLPKAA